MSDKIHALLSGAPMALASELAQDLLATDLPAIAAQVAWKDDGPSAAVQIERFVVQRGVAVVALRGILTPNNATLERWLGWSTYFGVVDALGEVASRADVAAIILDIDSPGGSVLGAASAAEAVAAAAKVKPVHAIASPLAASAAYWIGAQATDLTVIPGGLVGSIGVATTAQSFVGPGGNGAQYFNLTSTNARAKWPDASTEEGRAELQRSLDASEAQFHAAVAAGRGIAPADLAARLSVTDDPRDGGATFTGAEAIARGLADTVETRAAFYARMDRTYGGKPAPRTSQGYRARAAAAAALARL